MSCTNEDLEKLKAFSLNVRHSGIFNSSFADALDAAINRLEAAEACAWYAGNCDAEYLRNFLWIAWQKSKGK